MKQIIIRTTQGLSDNHADQLADYLLGNVLALVVTSDYQRTKARIALTDAIIHYVKANGTDPTPQ